MPDRALEGTQADEVGRSLIAPVWHTVLLAAAVLAVSLVGLRAKSHTAMATHHVRVYLETIGWEWALAAGVLWGLWMRGTPLRTLLGERRSGLRAWWRDAGIALVFWIAAMVVLSAVAVLLRLAHARMPDQTVAEFAPSNAGELALFIVLSLSAGFCEELLFRGYFQQQLQALGRGRVWVGVAAGALLFGLAHLYEGAAGVMAITVFGVLFSLLAVERRSLRAGMMAHAWHDSVSGLALFLLRHAHLV